MAELAAPADPAHYVDALKDALAALDGTARTALFGSTALWGLVGREPSTDEDLDLLVHPDDVDVALDALARAGFEVERPPEGWLVKAWHDAGDAGEPRVLVDLIFAPAGIESDAALGRARPVSVQGMHAAAVAPTDLLVSKASALGPQALDLQGALEFARLTREQVDWNELATRVVEDPYARSLLYLLRELDVAPADVLDVQPR